MALPRLSKIELRIMEALWTRGDVSVREIQEALPEKNRPAYTTVQTMVYRLEAKKAVRRVKKIGNAHIFAAAISRTAAQRRLDRRVPELLRRTNAAGHGASHRIRPSVARGRPGGGEDAAQARRRAPRRRERE